MKRKQSWDKHFKALKQLSSLRVQIGAIGQHDPSPDDKSGRTVSNAVILRVANNGLPSQGVAARFAITGPLLQNKKKIGQVSQTLLKKHFSAKGIDVKAVGEGIGLFLSGLVKKGIMDKLSPELKPAYLEKKLKQGFSPVPYIKTGQLIKSITHGVKT